MKRRLLSVLLTFTMVVSMVTMAFGTSGLVSSAAETDGIDSIKAVDLYWTRSKEFFYEELEKSGMSVYDNVLELEADNRVFKGATYDSQLDLITYTTEPQGGVSTEQTYYGTEVAPSFSLTDGADGVIRTKNGIKVITNPPTYYLADLLNNAKLGIAYADERLTTDTANTPQGILDAFNEDLQVVPKDIMGGINSIWDGGMGTYDGSTAGNIQAEFGQLTTTVNKIGELDDTANGYVLNLNTAKASRWFVSYGTNFLDKENISNDELTTSFKYPITESGIYYIGCSDFTFWWYSGNVEPDTGIHYAAKVDVNLEEGTVNVVDLDPQTFTELNTASVDVSTSGKAISLTLGVANGNQSATINTNTGTDTGTDTDVDPNGIKITTAEDFDGILNVKYLGKASGYAGYIWSTDCLYLNVKIGDNIQNSDAELVFESSDPTVVYVSDTGRAYPKKSGTVTITVKYVLNGVELASAAYNVTSNATVNNDFTDSTPNVVDSPVVGIYCNGVYGGNEIGIASSAGSWLLRQAGSTDDRNEFATWLTHTLSNNGEGAPNDFEVRGAETMRRFTAYFEVSREDYANHETFYLGNSTGARILSGDDSFYLFINGRPVIRASTNAGGGVDLQPISRALGFDASNTVILSNNNQGTLLCNYRLSGKSCDITDQTQTLQYAAGWHVHTDSASMNIKADIIPGQINRIDVIVGDYDDGGGMGRPYIYMSDEKDVYQEGAINVLEDPFTSPSDVKSFDEFTANTLNGKEVKEGQDVFYAFIVENTSEATLNDVELEDQNLGVMITKDGVYTQDTEGRYTNLVIDFNDDPEGKYTEIVDKLTTLEAGEKLLINIDNEVFYKAYELTDEEKASDEEFFYRNNSVIATGKYFPDPIGQPDYSITINDTDGSHVKIVSDAELQDDFVVIDYGLEVNVDVLANDGLDGGKVVGVSTSANGLTNKVEGKDYAGFVAEADIDFGKITINDDYTIKYVPYGIVDDIRSAYYAATENDAKYGAAEIKVLPATSVYYEDNFGETTSKEGEALSQVQGVGLVYSGNWSVVDSLISDTANNVESSALRIQEYNNELYGNDNAYDKVEVFSNGTSHAVGGTIYENETPYDIMKNSTEGLYESYLAAKNYQDETLASFDEENYYATFQFAGTGFDIISHSTENSGRITATVYKVVDGSTYEFDANGKLAVSGSECVKKITSDNLYVGGHTSQVPVISVKDLDAGNYIVQISVNNKQLGMASFGNVVYLDAIRIYNPLDASSVAGAKDNYAKEELNAANYELRDMVLAGAGESTDSGEGDKGTGTNKVTYIPAKYVTEAEWVSSKHNIADYIKVGPKNELYVYAGNAFSFFYKGDLEATDVADCQTLQIEAKLVDASASPFTITATNTRTGKTANVTVRSLTSMFYSLDEVLEGIKSGDRIDIIVSCDDMNDILSITNLKFNKNVTLDAVKLAPDTITIDQGDATTVSVGGTKQLTATLDPADAVNKGLTWTSSADAIISVNENGLITAKGQVGESAEITVTSSANPDVSDSITVTIEAISVTGIELSKNGTVVANGGSETVTVTAGQTVDTITFTAKVLPNDASQDYTFTVDNEEIATVNANGTVTVDPNKVTGDTNVTVTVISNQNNTIKATYTINVDYKVLVKSITIVKNGEDAGETINVDSTSDSFDLSALVNPTTADDTTYTLTTSDSSVVTINGGVATVNPDAVTVDTTVTVTATANDESGATDTVTIYIKKIPNTVSVTGIQLVKDGTDVGDTMNVKSTDAAFVINVKVSPDDATNKDYSIDATANVTAEGLVKAENGAISVDPAVATQDCTITITVTSDDGSYTDTLTINVDYIEPGTSEITYFNIVEPDTTELTLDFSSGVASFALPETDYSLKNDTFYTIVWEVTSGGTASIVEDEVFVSEAGTITLKATLLTTSGLTAFDEITYTITAQSTGTLTPKLTVDIDSDVVDQGYAFGEYPGDDTAITDDTVNLFLITKGTSSSDEIYLTAGKSYYLVIGTDGGGFINATNATGVRIDVATDGTISTYGLTVAWDYISSSLKGKTNDTVTDYTISGPDATGNITISLN